MQWLGGARRLATVEIAPSAGWDFNFEADTEHGTEGARRAVGNAATRRGSGPVSVAHCISLLTADMVNKRMMPGGLVKLFKFRLLRFFLVGAVNTAFSYCVYAGFLFLGVNYAAANLLALITGIFFSFRTQGLFVFRNTEQRLLGRFILVWLAIYFANMIVISQLLQLGLNAYMAGALAVIPITILSYFFQRFFVFRQAAPT